MAVKDSKNDIKVFTDKTTNDASYAPKSDFDKLKSIPKKYFYWNMDSKKSKLEIGTSAQEVMEVYPELVSINEAGMLSVAYDKLSVIALKAVDELHEENVALKEKNDELERRLKAIEEKLGI